MTVGDQIAVSRGEEFSPRMDTDEHGWRGQDKVKNGHKKLNGHVYVEVSGREVKVR